MKHQNSELKMKTQVELESLQEQLRVRKEKQYQLLEKLQGQEEAKRQAEDQVCVREDWRWWKFFELIGSRESGRACAACLTTRLTIDDASLSRRSTVPTPNKATTLVKSLPTFGRSLHFFTSLSRERFELILSSS